MDKKFKEIAKIDLSKKYFLTIEQENILITFLNLIKVDKDKVVFGLTSDIGDGKTYLLNYLIKMNNAIKLEENIFISNDICLIDDFDLLDENKQKQILSRYKYIFFTFKNYNENKLKIFFIKEKLINKNRLNYLKIENHTFYKILKNFACYSFRVIQKLLCYLSEKFKKFGGKLIKNPFLFNQKMIEYFIKSESNWENIKNEIVNFKDSFPNIPTSCNNIFKYLEKGIARYDNGIYKWNFEDILILIIFRNWTNKNKKNNLYSLPNYVFPIFKKSKLFQNSLIVFLLQKNNLSLISNNNIYLSSLLLIDKFSLTPINNKKIIFDLDSIIDIFNLFKNYNLKKIINFNILFNNSFNIIFHYLFNEQELLIIKNEFTDFEKLIIVAFSIIHRIEDLRLIQYINFDLAFEELKNKVNLDDLNEQGTTFLVYIFRLYSSYKSSWKYNSFFIEIEKKFFNFLGLNSITKENIAKLILEYSINMNMKIELVDNLFYYTKKTQLISSTNHMLNNVFQNHNNLKNGDNNLLKFFNYWIFSHFEKWTNNKEFINWTHKNWALILENNNIGFTEFYHTEILSNQLIYICVIRDNIIYKFKKMDLSNYYTKGLISIRDSRKFIIDLWEQKIKDNKNLDMEEFPIYDLIKELVVIKK